MIDSPAFPHLYTPRLHLRPLYLTDQAAIFSLRSNEVVNRYIRRAPLKRVAAAMTFIDKIKTGEKAGSFKFWVLSPRHSPELMGTICLWKFSADRSCAELGYELHPDYHRQGYMREAIAAVQAFSFDTMGLSAIEAYTHHQNEASIRLLTRQGFIQDAQRRDPDVATNRIYRLEKPALPQDA